MTVVAPAGRSDVAVPADLPLAQLLPVLLSRGAAGGPPASAWVLQRLGEPPLDDEESPAALGLRDGDVLYLRPAEAALPPIDFDDIVDGVSTAVDGLPGRWQPEHRRPLLLAAGGTVLSAGPAAVVVSAGGPAATVTAMVLALALVVTAGVFSRAFGDRAAATVAGSVAIAFAALAGSQLPALAASSDRTAGTALLAGSALAAAVTVLVSVSIGAANPFFGGVLMVAVSGAVAGLSVLWPGLSAAGAAAGVVAIAYLASVFLPNLVARLVRLPVPVLPSGRLDLDRDIEPHPEPQVITRAVAADRYLTALGGAVALVCAGGFVALSTTGGWLSWATLAVVSSGLLLRARGLAAIWQRLAAVVPGLIGTVLLVASVAAHGGRIAGIVLAVLAVVTGTLLVTGSARRDERESPYRGRLADIAETLTAIAVVPLAIGVMGGYEFARGLAG